MIVADAGVFARRYQVLENQQDERNRLQELERVRAGLLEVEQHLTPAMASYFLVEDRLDPEDRKRVDETRDEVRKRLHAARQRFADGGTPDVDPAKSAAERFQRELNEGWKHHLAITVKGYEDLTALVRQFGEFAERSRELEELIVQVRKRDKAPATSAQLESADALLDQIRSRARFIEELHRDVRAFLECVVQGRATLADISDETWRWLREGGHLTSMTVAFRGGGSE